MKPSVKFVKSGSDGVNGDEITLVLDGTRKSMELAVAYWRQLFYWTRPYVGRDVSEALETAGSYFFALETLRTILGVPYCPPAIHNVAEASITAVPEEQFHLMDKNDTAACDFLMENGITTRPPQEIMDVVNSERSALQ